MPGVSYPNPITWVPAEDITVPRLRGDITNMAAIEVAARPVIVADIEQSGIASGANTAIQFVAEYLNTWNSTILGTVSNAVWSPPFAGWWLVQGEVTFNRPGTVKANPGMGFYASVNGAAAAYSYGGAANGQNTTNDLGVAGTELYQFNPVTSDTLSWFALQNTGSAVNVPFGFAMAEWVGLPTSGLTGYTGPYGTVIAAGPVTPAPWPSGQGCTLSGSVSAGAGTIVVSDQTGMVAGGAIGPDFLASQMFTPVAEVGTISSVGGGGTVVLTGPLSYPHASGAPVAVPVSAAFLNQQVRDQVRFLAYPPILRAAAGTIQSIPSVATFPPTPAGNPTCKITTLGSVTVDNFSGFASNAYVAPLAGVYYVYGQVILTGTNSLPFAAAAGVSVNSGTIQWGTLAVTNPAAVGASSPYVVPTFRRQLRLNAQDSVTLWAFQDSGGAMNTIAANGAESKLIVVWRSQ